MKVYNLTDVSTPALVGVHMVNHTIAVGKHLLSPGGMAEVKDDVVKRLQPGLQALTSVGALAVGALPPSYLVAKQHQTQAAVKAPAVPAPAPPAPIAKAPTPPRLSTVQRLGKKAN